MNQRRGYCLSAAIITLDLLLTPFGGWLAAVASLVWAGGLGEWAARRKLGAVPCAGAASRPQRRLERCFARVMAQAEGRLPPFCKEVQLYSLPGRQVNGAAFGWRSIGITEGALQLDDNTVQAIIAHELGHIAHGDAVLNMVLTANIFSFAALLLVWQLAFGVFWLIVLAVALCGIRFGCLLWVITDRLSGLLRRGCETFRSVCVALVQILARAAGRKGELQADAFAVELGYGPALCRFLERFSEPPQPGRDLFDVLYSTHPDSALRADHIRRRMQQDTPALR